MQVYTRCITFAGIRLNHEFDRKVVDSKIHQIERRFRTRENLRHSGATDLPFWPLEDQIALVLGLTIAVTWWSSQEIRTPSPTKTTDVFFLSRWQTHDQARHHFFFSFWGEQGKQHTGKNSSQVTEPLPSTSGVSKKLTAKPSKTDQVLTYLKASVSILSRSFRGFCSQFSILGIHACCLMQDKAAADMHKENRTYKKQLIGLLAKVTNCMLSQAWNPCIFGSPVARHCVKFRWLEHQLKKSMPWERIECLVIISKIFHTPQHNTTCIPIHE